MAHAAGYCSFNVLRCSCVPGVRGPGPQAPSPMLQFVASLFLRARGPTAVAATTEATAAAGSTTGACLARAPTAAATTEATAIALATATA
eukprot:937971-Alexandrium_andersonii.AAC.1